MNVLNQLIDSAQRWAMYQGDCVETLRGIPDNSIHYSIFSPPFASLYTYSNSDRDMGNSSMVRSLYSISATLWPSCIGSSCRGGWCPSTA